MNDDIKHTREVQAFCAVSILLGMFVLIMSYALIQNG